MMDSPSSHPQERVLPLFHQDIADMMRGQLQAAQGDFQSVIDQVARDCTDEYEGQSLPKKAAYRFLYHFLAGADKEMMSLLFPLTDSTENTDMSSHPSSSACGYVFKEGDVIYRCRDCGFDETCVLCAPCFKASQHVNHDIGFSLSSGHGGCCDCGDPEAWTCDIACTLHPTPSQKQPSTTTTPSTLVDDDDTERVEHFELPTAEKYHMTESFFSALYPVLKAVCVFTTRALESAQRMRAASLKSDYIKTIGDLHVKRYCVLLYNDESHSFDDVIRALRAIGVATATAKEIAHTVDSHGRSLAYWSTDPSAALQAYQKLKKPGLQCVITDFVEYIRQDFGYHALCLLNTLAHTHTPIRRLLCDLFAHTLDSHPPEIRYHGFTFSPLTKDALIERRTMSTLPDGQYSHDEIDEENDTVHSDTHRDAHKEKVFLSPPFYDAHENAHTVVPRRGVFSLLEKLMLIDSRLWKEARITLRDFLVGAFLVDAAMKVELARCFARRYTMLMDNHMHEIDVDDGISMISLSVQLFTAPTVAHEVAKTHFLQRLFRSILRYTLDHSGNAATRVAALPALLSAQRATPWLVDLKAKGLQDERFFHLFRDLKYLLTGSLVRQYVYLHRDHYVFWISTCFALFHNMDRNKRAEDAHVSFESKTWGPAFHLMMQLASLIPDLAQPLSLIRGRRWFLRLLSPVLPQDTRRPVALLVTSVTRHTVTIHANTFHGLLAAATLPEYHVSFHHPLHWLWTYTLREKYLHGDREALWALLRSLHTHDWKSGRVITRVRPSSRPFLRYLIFDVMETMVLQAQVHAGYWVRNGYAIRNQLHNYESHSLRHLTRRMDLLLLQLSLIHGDPDVFVYQTLLQFGVLRALFGTETGVTVEDADGAPLARQEAALLADRDKWVVYVEELLLLLLAVVNERDVFRSSTGVDVQQRVIQVLSVGPLSHSKLLKRLTEEEAQDSRRLDEVLRDVATLKYVRNEHGNEQALYELKAVYLDAYRPFDFDLSRADRQRADEYLVVRRTEAAAAVMNKSDAEGAPWMMAGEQTGLGRLLHCEAMMRLWACVVARMVEDRPSCQRWLPMVVYWLSLMIEDAVQRDVQLFAEDNSDARWLAQLVSLHTTLLRQEDPRTAMRLDRVLTALQTHGSPAVRAILLEATSKENNEDKERHPSSTTKMETMDDSRRSAKERQDKILQDFKDKQSAFMRLQQQYPDIEEDEEDDDDDDNIGMHRERMDASMDAKMDAQKARTNTMDVSALGPCLLCQEELVYDGQRPFGLLATVNASQCVRDYELAHGMAAARVLQGDLLPETLSWMQTHHVFPAMGLHVSTCGHALHYHCLEKYRSTAEQSGHASNILETVMRAFRQSSSSPVSAAQDSEFACPLCKKVCNTMIPESHAFDRRPHREKPGLREALLAYIDQESAHHTRVLSLLAQPSTEGSARWLSVDDEKRAWQYVFRGLKARDAWSLTDALKRIHGDSSSDTVSSWDEVDAVGVFENSLLQAVAVAAASRHHHDTTKRSWMPFAHPAHPTLFSPFSRQNPQGKGKAAQDPVPHPSDDPCAFPVDRWYRDTVPQGVWERRCVVAALQRLEEAAERHLEMHGSAEGSSVKRQRAGSFLGDDSPHRSEAHTQTQHRRRGRRRARHSPIVADGPRPRVMIMRDGRTLRAMYSRDGVALEVLIDQRAPNIIEDEEEEEEEEEHTLPPLMMDEEEDAGTTMAYETPSDSDIVDYPEDEIDSDEDDESEQIVPLPQPNDHTHRLTPMIRRLFPRPTTGDRAVEDLRHRITLALDEFTAAPGRTAWSEMMHDMLSPSHAEASTTANPPASARQRYLRVATMHAHRRNTRSTSISSDDEDENEDEHTDLRLLQRIHADAWMQHPSASSSRTHLEERARQPLSLTLLPRRGLFCEATSDARGSTRILSEDPWTLMVDALAYTLCVVEATHRGDNAFYERLPRLSLMLCQTLFECCDTYLRLADLDTHAMLPELAWWRRGFSTDNSLLAEDRPFLAYDVFGMFVRSRFVPLLEDYQDSVVQMMCIVQLTKTLVSIATLVSTGALVVKEKEKKNGESNILYLFFDEICNILSSSSSSMTTTVVEMTWREVECVVERLMLPFVRQMALLVSLLYLPPAAANTENESGSEYERVCRFLRVEMAVHLREYRADALRWVAQWRDFEAGESPAVCTLSLPFPWTYRLIALPRDYSAMIELGASFTCPHCHTQPSDPAICLVCGCMVCCQTPCCQVAEMGECNMHAHQYESGLGLYLIIKQCLVLVIQGSQASFVDAPYTDSHGETDVHLKRGKPLFFNERKYEELTTQWMQHALSSVISRRMDQVMNIQALLPDFV